MEEELIEKAKKKTKDIPPSKLKWLRRPVERRELPAHHFLLPKERKFPYKNKDGTVNCRLLRAVIVRSAQHGYPNVEKRARKLYERHCKEKAWLPLLTYDDYRILDWWESQPLTPEPSTTITKAVETTPNEIRIRVKSPDKYDPKSFRYITISEDKGIKAVIGCPKGKFKGGKCEVGTEIQSYRFDKEKWSKSEAKKWVEEHKKALIQADLTKATTILRINSVIPSTAAKQILDASIQLETIYVCSDILAGKPPYRLSSLVSSILPLDKGSRMNALADYIKAQVLGSSWQDTVYNYSRALRDIEVDTEYVKNVINKNSLARVLFERVVNLQSIPEPPQPEEAKLLPAPMSAIRLGVRLSRGVENYLEKAESFRLDCCKGGLELAKFVDSLLKGYVAPYNDLVLRKLSAFNVGYLLGLGSTYQLSKSTIEYMIDKLTLPPPLLVSSETIKQVGEGILQKALGKV